MPNPAEPQHALLLALAGVLGTARRRVVAGVVLVAGLIVAATGALVAVRAFSTDLPKNPPELVLPRADEEATTPGRPASDAKQLVVHAAGAVLRPGLLRLPAGARVADLVAAAGGPSPEADLDQLNLAARVSDGERVYVPRRGEAVALGPASEKGVPAGPLDLNTATAEQLDGLPGVGPATAHAIVEWRRQNGRFRRVADLLEVRGIGPAKFAALRSQVRV